VGRVGVLRRGGGRVCMKGMMSRKDKK